MFFKITVTVLCVVFVHAGEDPTSAPGNGAPAAAGGQTNAPGNGSQPAAGVHTNAPVNGPQPAAGVHTNAPVNGQQPAAGVHTNAPVNGQPGTQTPVTTPKPKNCMSGSCTDATGACINKLTNTKCTGGVCTTKETKVTGNETYSTFAVACESTYKDCTTYKAATKATGTEPVPTCCETDLCNKYVADSAAPNTAVNIIVLAMVTGLLRKMLVVVANP